MGGPGNENKIRHVLTSLHPILTCQGCIPVYYLQFNVRLGPESPLDER